jgi:hypothetical protein
VDRTGGSTTAAAALGVGLAAIAFQLPVFDRSVSFLDEGHILQFADIVQRGGELYRDASALALPGAFYLLALAFDVFGPSNAAARWLLMLEFSAFAVLIHLLLRRTVSPAAAWLGVALIFLYKLWVFPHWLMYSYSTTAQCLLAGALLLVVRHCEDPSPWRAIGAGLLTGLAVLCKQDYGVAGLLAFNVALLLAAHTNPHSERPRHLRALAWYNGPAVAIGALTALHFLRQGLLGEMLQQTLLDPFIGMATDAYSSLPPILPLFEQTPIFRSAYGYSVYVPPIVFALDWDLLTTSAFYRRTFLWDWCLKLFFYAPYAIAAAGAARAWRKRSALRDPVRRLGYLRETTLVLFAGAAILSLHKPVDYVHVGVLYWPFLLLLVVWGDAALRGRPRAARAALLLALAPSVAIVGYSGRLLWRLHAHFDTPVHSERAGVRASEADAAVLGAALDYLQRHTRPDERVAVLPYFPLLSFLAGRDAPHREMYTLWPVEYDPDRQRQVIQALEENAADVAIYSSTQFPQLPRMREFAPRLFAYLVDHWEIDRVFSHRRLGYLLAGLRRSEAAPVGTPLDVAGDAVRLYVEEPGRGPRSVPKQARAAYVRLELWPFRRVVALRPSCGSRRSVLSVPVDISAGSRLRTAIGFDAQHWVHYPPSAVTYSIRAVMGGERVGLFERRLDPHVEPRDRGWTDVDLDLGRFGGRRVDLEFATRCETPISRDTAMGGFEIPRLVTR